MCAMVSEVSPYNSTKTYCGIEDNSGDTWDHVQASRGCFSLCGEESLKDATLLHPFHPLYIRFCPSTSGISIIHEY